MPLYQEFYQMRTKNSFITLIFMCLTIKVMAFEQVHYGDGAKDVVVNSQEPSLLMFPSPPIARVCHPSGVVDFFPIEESGNEMNPTLSSVEWNLNQSKTISDSTERMLKLRPYQDSQVTLCDIKLANSETVTLRFKTSSLIKRPSIEFVNVFSNQAKNIKKYDNDSLEIFQKLLSGGELFNFYDMTTSKDDPILKTTVLAKYAITYIGTDREKYKVWKVRVSPKAKAITESKLKNVKLNQIHFSAWKKGKELYLFILSSNDISTEELMEKLP